MMAAMGIDLPSHPLPPVPPTPHPPPPPPPPPLPPRPGGEVWVYVRVRDEIDTGPGEPWCRRWRPGTPNPVPGERVAVTAERYGRADEVRLELDGSVTVLLRPFVVDPLNGWAERRTVVDVWYRTEEGHDLRDALTAAGWVRAKAWHLARAHLLEAPPAPVERPAEASDGIGIGWLGGPSGRADVATSARADVGTS